MQSQGLALPPEPKVGPFATRGNTKESCVISLGQDPDTGDLEKSGLYVDENLPAKLPLEDFMRGWRPSITSLWAMIKSR